MWPKYLGIDYRQTSTGNIFRVAPTGYLSLYNILCISGLLHRYIYSNLIELSATYYVYIPVQIPTFCNELMLVRLCSESYTWGIFSLLLYHWESCSFIISLLSWFYAAIFFIIHVFLLWFVSCLAYHFLDIFAPRVIPLFLHCYEGSVDQILFYLLIKELKFVMIYIYM